jgi:hypothetical protein
MVSNARFWPTAGVAGTRADVSLRESGRSRGYRERHDRLENSIRTDNLRKHLGIEISIAERDDSGIRSSRGRCGRKRESARRNRPDFS